MLSVLLPLLVLGLFPASSFALAPVLQWESVGGPEGGPVHGIDADGGEVWIAARGAGPHRWTGDGWEFRGHGLPSQVAECIALRGETVYLGLYEQSLHTSSDGGRNWAKTNSPLDVVALAVHPNDEQTVLVGSYNYRTVAKTTDGGKKWTNILWETGAPVSCIAFAPSNPDIIFVGTENSGPDGGLYASTDAGRRWTRIDSPAFENSCMAIVVDPADPRHLFAGSHFWGIFETTDGGARWVARNQGLEHRNIRDLISLDLNRGLESLLAGTSLGGVYRSDNGGLSWRQLASGLAPKATGRSLLAHHDTTWLGTDEGAFSLGPNDTWNEHSTDLWGQFIVDLVPLDLGAAVATESGVFVRSTAASPWRRPNPGQAPGEPMTSITIAGDVLLGCSGAQIHRSDDQGETWSRSDRGIRALTQILDIAGSPQAPGRAWAASVHSLLLGGGLYRSDDGGRTWREKNRGLGILDWVPLQVHAHPTDMDVVYTLIAYKGIFRSENAGEQWQPASDGLGLIPSVATFEVAAADPSLLFAGGGNGEFYRSRTGADSWEAVAPLPGLGTVYQIKTEPTNADHVVALTSAGILSSHDQGENWTWIDRGLPTSTLPSVMEFIRGEAWLGTAGESLLRRRATKQSIRPRP